MQMFPGPHTANLGNKLTSSPQKQLSLANYVSRTYYLPSPKSIAEAQWYVNERENLLGRVSPECNQLMPGCWNSRLVSLNSTGRNPLPILWHYTSTYFRRKSTYTWFLSGGYSDFHPGVLPQCQHTHVFSCQWPAAKSFTKSFTKLWQQSFLRSRAQHSREP